METAVKIPYVYFDKLCIGDNTIDFSEILDKNNYHVFFHEVYVIQDDTIWFGFSDAQRNEDGSRKWNIASMKVTDQQPNICYSGLFCMDTEADQYYVQNNNDHSKDGYQSDNGFYYDGKIVLTDHVKTVEYDLETNTASEFLAAGYEYPSLEIKAEIVDYHTINFITGSLKKVFDVERGKLTSNVFGKIFDLEKETNWEGMSCVSHFFDKIQIIDNQIYILCSVMNWHGETHAIVFQYDYDTNSCKYAFHCFMNDVIGNDLYIVPTT